MRAAAAAGDTRAVTRRPLGPLLPTGIALAALALAFAALGPLRPSAGPRSPVPGQPLELPAIHAQPQPHDERLAFLPWLGQHRVAWPDPARTARFWAAVDAFAAAHPLDGLYPRYGEPPSLDAATANVAQACADFPDLPDVFGPGAHRRACDVWVANSLALHHIVVARRLLRGDDAFSEGPASEHQDWASIYRDITVEGMSDFVYGPVARTESGPTGRFRDTRAAVWQNPLRAADLGLVLSLQSGPRVGFPTPEPSGGPWPSSPARQLLADTAFAWRVHFDHPRDLPAAAEVITTNVSQEGDDPSTVISNVAHIFRWAPSHGNSAIEEMAWMGAGARLAAAQGFGRQAWAVERPRIASLAEAYLDFTFSAGRPSPFTGRPAHTLNEEGSGGAYGQNRLWIENHQPDMPSVPYLFSTWHYLSLAAMAHEGDPAVPWPALADPAHWRLIVDAGEATLHAPDGTFLVDLSPGGELGFAMGDHPAVDDALRPVARRHAICRGQDGFWAPDLRLRGRAPGRHGDVGRCLAHDPPGGHARRPGDGPPVGRARRRDAARTHRPATGLEDAPLQGRAMGVDRAGLPLGRHDVLADRVRAAGRGLPDRQPLNVLAPCPSRDCEPPRATPPPDPV